MDCKLIIFSFIRNFVRGMLIMYMLVKIHLRLVFTGDGVIVVVEVVGALPTLNREAESKEESSTGRNWKNENGFIFFRFRLRL